MNFESSLPLLSAAILAGGKSSRMGKDKSFLQIEGKTFISRIISELSQFDEVLISANDDSYKTLGFPVISDATQDFGPLEGICRVLEKSRNEAVFVCASDMPFIKKEVPLYLSQFISSDFDLYVLTSEGKFQPMCAIYTKKCIPQIKKCLENQDLSVKSLFNLVRTKFIPIELSSLDKKTIININTPQDYNKATSPFVFCVSGIKNSGKTSMILSLISELKKRNHSVGVIKHDGHDCFTDAPNTDTAYFTDQGAVTTAVFSDSRFAFHATDKTSIENLIEKMKSLQNAPDIIIIEGLKDSSYPKIEVLRKNVSEKSVCNRENLICTASDFKFCLVGVPNFDFKDVGLIADCVESYFCKETL